MSATDRIRARVDPNRYVIRGTVGVSAPVPLTVEEVETLCDLADAARSVKDVADGEEIDLSHCPYYRKERGLPGGDAEGIYGPGTCVEDCVDEPACVTSGPWALDELRAALARLDGEAAA